MGSALEETAAVSQKARPDGQHSAGWQDISTRPMSGPAFLVWCPEHLNTYLVWPTRDTWNDQYEPGTLLHFGGMTHAPQSPHTLVNGHPLK